jgi:predicted HTH domain antitoxin
MGKGKVTKMANMVPLQTEIPEDIFLTLQARGLFKEELVERSRQLMAIRFYQERLLSLGKAARLAGMGRWNFIELLSSHHVPVIDYSEEEMAAEFAVVEKLAGGR